jgi:transposase
MQITTIGLDLAKNVFQVHGIDATGQVVVRKSLRRSQMLPFFAELPSCLVGGLRHVALLGARADQARS